MLCFSQVTHFCDDSNHVTAAPTKHNLLCGEKSVWEVMQSHEDFRGGNNPPNANSTPPEVDFRVVKATTDRFFFLLESTATMRQQQRWDFVSNSIRKFINWDAPTGIQVGIGHFGSAYRTDRELTTVPASLIGRGELANLPPLADNVLEENKSWRLALDGALNSLGQMAAGATIIWVTGNAENSDVQPDADDIDFMIARLQENQVGHRGWPDNPVGYTVRPGEGKYRLHREERRGPLFFQLFREQPEVPCEH